MKGNCTICKSSKNVRNYQGKQILCGMHREQMRRFGKIRERTLMSRNLYVNHSPINDCMEVVIYNRKLEEKGRALIDPEDYERVSAIGSWSIDGSGYVVNGKYKIKLHQLIMGMKEGLEIDHINRNKLDNRKTNLRFVTHRENTLNRKTKGWYQRPNGRWSAYIAPNGKMKHLGTFDTMGEAIDAHTKARQKAYGKYHIANEKDIESFFKEL